MDDNSGQLKLLIKNLLYSNSDLSKSVAITRLKLMGYNNKKIIKKAKEFGFIKEVK